MKNPLYIIWLIKIGQMITKKLDRMLQRYGLTFNQAHVLFIIHRRELQKQELSMQQLSDILLVSLANMSGLADRLERDGYMKRVQSQKDRRTFYLHLTKKGRQMVKKLDRQWPPKELQKLDSYFRRLPRAQQKQFYTILTAVSEYLHEEPARVMPPKPEGM